MAAAGELRLEYGPTFATAQKFIITGAVTKKNYTFDPTVQPANGPGARWPYSTGVAIGGTTAYRIHLVNGSAISKDDKDGTVVRTQ